MARPADRPLHVVPRTVAIGAGLACLGLAFVLSRFPGSVESVYAGSLGPLLTSVLSRLSGVLPFSIAEWVILGFVLRQVVSGGLALRQVVRKRRGPLNALAAATLRLGADLGIVVVLFYVLWGFNYVRAPLGARQGWPTGPPRPAELARLAEQSVAAANAAYRELHGSEDFGVPTPHPDRPGDAERAIDGSWDEVALALAAPGLDDRVYGPAKPLMLGRALSYLGLQGFFFPFTGESNVNNDVPAATFYHALAHEKAHQRGFAPEDEANFVGFLAAAIAEDPLPRYSAYLFAQRQLLRALRAHDAQRAAELARKRLPGVRRDLAHLRAYWVRYQGPAARAANRVNDAYLRSQRVSGGVGSYRRSLMLIVRFARAQDGRLVPDPR